jgi:hypothetical protein
MIPVAINRFGAPVAFKRAATGRADIQGKKTMVF